MDHSQQLCDLQSQRAIPGCIDQQFPICRIGLLRHGRAVEEQLDRQYLLAAIHAVGNNLGCGLPPLVIQHDGCWGVRRRLNSLQPGARGAEAVGKIKAVGNGFNSFALGVPDPPGILDGDRFEAYDGTQPLAFGACPGCAGGAGRRYLRPHDPFRQFSCQARNHQIARWNTHREFLRAFDLVVAGDLIRRQG